MQAYVSSPYCAILAADCSVACEHATPSLDFPIPPPSLNPRQECLPKKMGVGREVLRGRRTYCTVQVDFVDLPPNHRIMPLWEVDSVMVVSVHRSMSSHVVTLCRVSLGACRPSLALCCRAAAFSRPVLPCCCLHSPWVVVLLPSLARCRCAAAFTRPVLPCCCLPSLALLLPSLVV